jgi:squalene-hopene/tetraprenyl-beta-curcumene cyclase
LLVALAGPTAGAADKTRPPTMDPAVRQQSRKAIDRGLEYLAASQQADGGWESFGKTDPAITSLVVKGFIQHPAYGADHAIVKRGMAFIRTFAHPDGGIYVDGIGLRNYYTSVALMALAAGRDASSDEAIRKAQAFLVKGQWDEEDDHDRDSAWYGGAGYGKHKRPDLSNTQLMLEALHQSGLPADHPAYRKALVFVQRCQMSSGSNDQSFAATAHDGGFIYTCANGGESKAGTVVVDGRSQLRSYGSMTYAGFKSMLYARVDRDDARVRAAHDWIRSHYTLDANPNMPDKQSREGLYYYYHVFARALYAWGQTHIVDAAGKSHNWREDLSRALLARQREDGSWVNQADRWYEGNPHLVTAYAVLALQTALKE